MGCICCGLQGGRRFRGDRPTLAEEEMELQPETSGTFISIHSLARLPDGSNPLASAPMTE